MGDARRAMALAFASGLLSLGMEIAWTRLVAFVHHAVPQAFAYVLFCYLLGIALGAHAGKTACARLGTDVAGLWRLAGRCLAWSALFDVAALGAFVFTPRDSLRDAVVLLVVLAGSAALKGVVFPVAHALGSLASTGRLGASISDVYAANVAGATLGPLLVGFWLLDVATLQQAVLACAVAALAVGTAASWAGSTASARAVAGLGGAGLVALIAVDPHWLVRRLVQRERGAGTRVEWVQESRHGVIHVQRDEDDHLVVYGENVYDGRVSTSLVEDVNGLFRAHALAAMHESPRRVLVIGLSTGSWVEVLRHLPGVEHLDVVEINPHYRELVAQHPAVAGLLSDPRVHLHFTDARKHLRHQPARYDLVVMNTSWHWRAYTSLLLGEEFLSVLRDALEPGGVVAFNATGSIDEFHTATQEFPFAGRYSTFVYGSDHDLRPSLRAGAERIRHLAEAVGHPDDVGEDLDRAAAVTAATGMEVLPGVSLPRPPETVTERNMVIEYRHGRGLVH